MIFLKGQCMGAAFFEEWNHAFIGVKSCFYRNGIMLLEEWNVDRNQL